MNPKKKEENGFLVWIAGGIKILAPGPCVFYYSKLPLISEVF
jgi:hypothetical protein